MSKKKLLSEAQIRRFMGLAGMESNLVSNVISEMTYQEDDMDPADAEAPAPEGGELEDPMAGEEADMGGEMDAEAPVDGEVSLEQEDVEELKALFDKVMGQLLPGGAEEPDLGEPASDEPMDMGGEEEEEEEPMGGEEEEELAEVSLQLSEEEIVQEVARRVAKRIIKAKRAKKQLDEALGKK